MFLGCSWLGVWGGMPRIFVAPAFVLSLVLVCSRGAVFMGGEVAGGGY